MNYFAHARLFLDRPYFVVGTAVPDWLNVVNRRAKARSNRAEEILPDSDPRVRLIAEGIIQHHADDLWFHQTRAFAELSLQFAVVLRDHLAGDAGFRPSFLGHILVELLLDAALIEERPDDLDRYYALFDQIDPAFVTETVNRVATQPVDLLEQLIPRFSKERFLYDYADDEKLLTRLNHVMKRVGLPALPFSLVEILADARTKVRDRKTELLTNPGDDK